MKQRFQSLFRVPLKGWLLFFSVIFIFNACGPAKKATIQTGEAYRPHTVAQGENISRIANTYNVTIDQIKLLNPGVNLSIIHPGQVIKIPFNKPEPKKENEEAKKEAEPSRKSVKIKIALLLPFNASHNAESNTTDGEISIDPSTIPWIHFYEGVMVAVDSLSSDGTNFEVSLYDTWKDSSKLAKLIRDSLFVKNDLVIGAGVTGFLPALTTAAAQNQKPLVITQNNSAAFLEGHPELFLTTPSIALQCKLMSDYLYENYGKENLVILHQDNKKESDLAALFSTALQVKQLSSPGTDSLRIKNFVYNGKLFEKGSTLLDMNKKNIIIVPSSDEAFVSPIISRLDSLDEYQFVVCGIPTWESFESMDPQKLQKLQTLIFSSSYIDYTNTNVKSFRKYFIDKYKSDPLYNAYLGFSIVYLAGTVLEKGDNKDFARILEKKESKENKSIPSKFDFRSKTKEDGKENHRISILKFENYKLVPVD